MNHCSNGDNSVAGVAEKSAGETLGGKKAAEIR